MVRAIDWSISTGRHNQTSRASHLPVIRSFSVSSILNGGFRYRHKLRRRRGYPMMGLEVHAWDVSRSRVVDLCNTRDDQSEVSRF